ncbi:MAG: redoxin domain-containing protein [Candidatus Magasanikbacteria bacterium]|nr:redoxin domain-containing protein [Candidatus Magasanikbacteria bacterium]
MAAVCRAERVPRVFIGGAIFYLEAQRPSRLAKGSDTIEARPAPRGESEASTGLSASLKQSRFQRAREIVDSSGYLNHEPFTLKNLIGRKIILVDFWTYSCINCQRTIPYLNAWYDKYRDRGLEIVGVHTPEFAFEKKYDNVRAAVERFGIRYPVVMDNDYLTWNNYGNRYWPHKYLIDIDGYIVYDHIGEGGYEATEAKIQELLDEKMQRDALSGAAPLPLGFVRPAEAEVSEAGSPEIYFGASRNEYLGNGQRGKTGSQNFTLPERILGNELYLSGRWNLATEYAENLEAAGRIIFRYRAKNVYLVGSAARPVTAQILLDGRPLDAATAGADVRLNNGQSIVEFRGDRLYHLIKTKAVGEHTLEIILEAPGLKAYTFTFG